MDPPASAKLGEPPLAGGVPPLCVDLDGTLVQTDCLWEGLAQMLFHHPVRLAGILLLAWRGRPWLKHQVSEFSPLAAASLPYNAEVMALIAREKAAGRKVILATASDQLTADVIAAHVKVFDEVLGSDGVTNLRGRAKTALLVKKFGRGGFDYAGDSTVDYPVWEAARHAYVVRASAAVRARMSGRSTATILGQAGGSWRALWRALRPLHWAGNVLIFPPLLTVRAWPEAETWWKLAGFFLALCLSESAVYLLRDLADLHSDQRRRDHWRQPVPDRAPPIPGALAATLVCLGWAALLCELAGGKAFVLLLAFIVAASACLFFRKRLPILGLLLWSGLCVFRIVAGAEVALVKLAPWLIALSVSVFLIAAAGRRYAEARRKID